MDEYVQTETFTTTTAKVYIDGVLKLLPIDASYYFTKADSHRALKEDLLQQKANAYNLKGDSYPMVAQAFKAAMRQASKDDVIYVGGSSYVVGDFLKSRKIK